MVGLDAMVIPLVYLGAFSLRFEGIPAAELDRYTATLPMLFGARLLAFVFSDFYRASWRHIGLRDLLRVLRTITVGSAIFLAALFLSGQQAGFPRSLFVIEWMIALFVFAGQRVWVRSLREQSRRERRSKQGRPTLIIGAGDAAAQLLRQLHTERNRPYRPVGMLDDNPLKQNVRIHGVPVLGTTAELRRVVEDKQIEMVIFAIPSATKEALRRVVDRCRGVSVDFKIVPTLGEMLSGGASAVQVRDFNVEELLGRPSVTLDMSSVHPQMTDQVILVSGAGGSIGSELSRQLAGFRPRRLVLLDRGETALYSIDSELARTYPDLDVVPLIADITDQRRLHQAFARYAPTHVFHAAACKHVPLMEENVEEAVRSNVLGTFTLAEAATNHGVRRFVLISTDKAVNPSSVMGATKRVAERLLLSSPRFKDERTEFLAVRFGNVLDSNGSVIPRFKEQIAGGGPVTVTHPDVERYFMTIQEAVHLVLQAAILPEATGRICLLEMGHPVRILGLAESLIRLSGLEPYRDMPIVFTGLRPGEKLKEELATLRENTAPTPLEKVRILTVVDTDGAVVEDRARRLIATAASGEVEATLEELRLLVPECVEPLRGRGSTPLSAHG